MIGRRACEQEGAGGSGGGREGVGETGREWAALFIRSRVDPSLLPSLYVPSGGPAGGGSRAVGVALPHWLPCAQAPCCSMRVLCDDSLILIIYVYNHHHQLRKEVRERRKGSSNGSIRRSTYLLLPTTIQCRCRYPAGWGLSRFGTAICSRGSASRRGSPA